MRQKNIQIISHSFPNAFQPYDGIFVRDHASATSTQFNVEVLVPTPYAIPFTAKQHKNRAPLYSPDNIKTDRVRYFSLPSKIFPSLIRSSLSKKLTSYLRKRKPHLIHIHFLYSSGLAIPALKNALNCPVVITIHGVDFYHTVNKPKLRELLLESLHSADAIIAVGPQLRKDILAQFPELDTKLHTIHNYVDTSYFFPVSIDSKQNLKKELGLSSDRFQLLSVANFRYKKGIDLLVEALSMANERTEIDLHLIGRRNEEPEFEAAVLSTIAKKGIQNFHIHGPKPRGSIQKWMQAVDGFILPSRNEPFGISLIEAMACGLPVISTKSGGPEVILSGSHGILVSKENPKALSDAIVEMAAKPKVNLKEQLQFTQDNFGMESYIKAHIELYKNLFY